MRLPSKLMYKGKEWKIIKCAEIIDSDLGHCDALTDFDELTISIDKTLSSSEQLLKLTHELIHITLHEYHLHETGGIVDDFAHEVICSGVASMLQELFTIKLRSSK